MIPIREIRNKLLSTYSQFFILQIKVVENMSNYQEVKEFVYSKCE